MPGHSYSATDAMSASVKINVPGNHLMAGLLGERDRYVRAVEDAFNASIHVRGNEISLKGAEAPAAAKVFEELVVILQQGQSLEPASVLRAIQMVQDDESPSEILTDRVLTTQRGKAVRPKTAGQKRYLDAIRENIVTFAIGPAGTGKSWLAVACAIRALQDKEVERILLTRPAVEAGERLGYLPGDLMSKVDPYLRPLYDALHDMLGSEGSARLFERNLVEVAPLAFMRGRTLNDSFIILDEAQNSTGLQMKMFLTRLGVNSQTVVTGDKTQIDLPQREESGLVQVERILANVEGVAVRYLHDVDVVRHRLVREIVRAYAEDQSG